MDERMSDRYNCTNKQMWWAKRYMRRLTVCSFQRTGQELSPIVIGIYRIVLLG